MVEDDVNLRERRFLSTATTVASGIAAGAAAVPFVASMLPSERAKAAGAPVPSLCRIEQIIHGVLPCHPRPSV